MVPPLIWLASDGSDGLTGERLGAAEMGFRFPS
jgi:hypothetical protein